MTAVLTPADLAEILQVDEAKVLEWRRTYNWPSFKVGRKVRFTSEHVEQIIASHSGRPHAEVDSSVVVALPGQTKRSASRGRA